MLWTGVNILPFKWIIIWEKFPKNGLWGRVSSLQRPLPLRVNKSQKAIREVLPLTLPQGTLKHFPGTNNTALKVNTKLQNSALGGTRGTLKLKFFACAGFHRLMHLFN